MDLTIVDEVSPSCDEFVRLQPEAELCHLTGWSNMVQERFGHRCYYLVAREDQQIKGVLLVAFIRSRIFGNRMVSQPFSDYGGPLVISEAVKEILYKAAIELSRRHHCNYIEFRNTKPMPYDLILRTDKACMYLPLCADLQVIWTRLRPQIRNRIRKAMSSHIVIKQGGMELLEDFYHIWTIRMSQLGTPCYHRNLFEGILDTFASEAAIFLAELEGKVIGGLFAYEFNRWAHTRWGAVLRQCDPISPNYLLNWSAIEFYCHKRQIALTLVVLTAASTNSSEDGGRSLSFSIGSIGCRKAAGSGCSPLTWVASSGRCRSGRGYRLWSDGL